MTGATIVILAYFFAGVAFLYWRNRPLQPFRGNINVVPAINSPTLYSVVKMSLLKEDQTETIKAFYDVRYESASFIIKGLGAAILAFITPFVEKFITNTRGADLHLNLYDGYLLLTIGLLLVVQVILCMGLKKIALEYIQTINLYLLLK